jgi:ferrous iron transport protein B
LRPLTIALVGNPNTGKTALFNALTGYNRHVANYAGVTVDVGSGRVRGAGREMIVLDLPGTYSLTPASPDETILCAALYGRIAEHAAPAVILAIADASNPVRNMYLISQLLDVGVPVVLALNMVDIAERRGIHVDAARLAQRLAVPVVPIVATRPETVRPLIAALEQAADSGPPSEQVALPAALRAAAAQLAAQSAAPLSAGEALRLLADQGGYAEQEFLKRDGNSEVLETARQRLRGADIDPGPTEVRARYAWVDHVLDGVIERRMVPEDTWSNRLDRLLTHRIGGVAVLLALLYGVFYAIYAGAAPLMRMIEGLFGWLGGVAGSVLGEGVARSLLADGLLAGVGGVLAFLPQILILFVFIAILEDCGYLARAAFMVDRLMRPLGLSGRAFIPLLSAFACTVPAIMGTRAIADRRERFITILIAPFMSCSARLPIYVLMVSAFVPPQAWLGGWIRLDALVMLGVYVLGALVAIPIAIVLRRTAFAGPASTFLLELPTYKLPRLRTIWQRVSLAGRSFIVRAGTIILLVNIAVWALGYFPRSDATRTAVEQRAVAEGWDAHRTEGELAGAFLRESYLGRLGHALEPAVRPLGWDWRIGIGVIASFPAREVVIATLGTVSNLGDAEADTTSLKEALRGMRREDNGAPLFTLPVALSLMVFFALCAQCASTLVMIGRETGSWIWPVVSFTTMTTLAYAGAWATAALTHAIGF